LARSTDSGQSFQNYAWTTEAFEAGGVFFGDYSGIAAFDGRVYGIWTEKPAPAPEAAKKNEGKTEEKPDDKSENKAGEKEKAESKPGEAKPKRPGTVVKVGVADFKNEKSGTLQ
jgi:hypothetical protein